MNRPRPSPPGCGICAAIGRRCSELLDTVDDGIAALAASPGDGLADGIMLAAAAVRFLRSEPLLPADLTPTGWPADRLRQRYDVYDRALGRALRQALDQPLP